MLAAEPDLVLEFLRQLHGGVEPAFSCLIEQDAEDHILLAQPFGIELAPDVLPDQALAATVEFHPAARDFVDQHGLEAGAVTELDMQLALGLFLVGAEQDGARGVVAAQRAGAGERQEGIVLHLLLAELLRVVGEDDARLGGDLVAQRLNPALQEEHHRRVVVLPLPAKSSTRQSSLPSARRVPRPTIWT